MNKEEHHLFHTLKQKVAAQFLQNHSANADMTQWKGEEIVQFQEDLFEKVKAKVSEKWFYTYFKNQPEKLPRIDILNLLSNYIGYTNWNDFKAKNSTSTSKKKGSTLKFILVFVILGVLAANYFFFSTNTFEFCFVDDNKGDVITTTLDIKILKDKQSPIYLKTENNGCFTYETKAKKISFVVQSPFYKTDTIVRYIDANENKLVKLSTDDYALMLDYYTNGKIKDYNKRKAELHKLIDDNAVIYELFKNNVGVEIYTKEEFIRKLTIPTNQLKHVQILDKMYANGKIVKLKFIVE